MKHLLLTAIAAVVLVGCGKPNISINDAIAFGNIKAVKQHLDAGTDVNAMAKNGAPLHLAAAKGHTEIAEGAEVDPNIQTGPKGVLRSGINTRTDKEIKT
ncbi:MAG TPA: ankyrin repeat domain-containing protein [Nitrospirales bacterium]|nr:ankyrin repeat domain-containing protein [Nitrospirales bacterium]